MDRAHAVWKIPIQVTNLAYWASPAIIVSGRDKNILYPALYFLYILAMIDYFTITTTGLYRAHGHADYLVSHPKILMEATEDVIGTVCRGLDQDHRWMPGSPNWLLASATFIMSRSLLSFESLYYRVAQTLDGFRYRNWHRRNGW